MKRHFACIALIAAALALNTHLQAQQQEPIEPPKMEPEKIGPRTEQVDVKSYAMVLHVAPSGSAQGDGSQAKPFASVAEAVAGVNDANSEKRWAIFVAAGEYKGDTVQMKPYVDLFGGFDASGWQRDIDANRSILDGEGQRRLVVGADNARIDGFVMRNGKVRGPGGAILCDHTSPTISNNTIINNATLEPEGIDKKMIHQQGNDGGAIACINGSSGMINNNIIANNRTDLGGGGAVFAGNYSMPNILNNVLTGNETGLTDVNESRSSNGGAISASHAPIRPPLRMTVVNNVISNNTAGGNSDGGGIYLEYDSSPIIGANWLLGNAATDDGGGIYVMKSSHPLFIGNVVAGNNSSAIRLSKEGRGDIEHNLVFSNASSLNCVSSWMLLKNNTIVDNGGGVSYANPYAPHFKPPVITQNLIYGNGGPGVGVDSGNPNIEPPVVTKNNIEGGYPSGDGNFDENPQFADDGVQGQAESVEYDEQTATTSIAVSELSSGGAKLAADVIILDDNKIGRVINVGGRWGVIKQASDFKIVVWGDLRSPDGQKVAFNIAKSYKRGAAVAGDVGAQIP